MFCPHCGSEQEDAQGICQECGRQSPALVEVGGADPRGAGSTGKCLQCGFPLAGDEWFCGECGTRIPQTSLERRDQKEKREGTGGLLVSSESTRHYAPTSGGIHESPLFKLSDKTYGGISESLVHPFPVRVSVGGIPTLETSRRKTAWTRSASVSSVSDTAVGSMGRSHTALIISLICFLASLISGGAAIWLAATALH